MSMGYFESDAEEMLDIYLTETRQLAEQLNGVLLEAERKNSFAENDIHSVFRIMHTIKSSSAMMGLGGLSSMAHKLEDLFACFREKKARPDKVGEELFDLLFAALDLIDGELKRMTDEDYKPCSTEEIEEKAGAFLQSLMNREAKPEAKDGGKELKKEDTLEAAPVSSQAVPDALKNKGGVTVWVRFEEGCRMENIRAFMLLRQIGGLCSCIECYPPDPEKNQQSASYIEQNGFYIRFESGGKKDEVLQVLQKGLFVHTCEVVEDHEKEAQTSRQTEQKEQPAGGESRAPGADNGGRETNFLEVRTERLDQLQNLAGELLIQLQNLDGELEQRGLEDLREGTAHQMSRLVSEVERTVMEMRMVPVSRIVPKLRRILRDICRDQKKEAELIVRCGDIEADKSVVEYISEALMHLIRNAVDHGIEAPDIRESLGKERRGRVSFCVENTGGELLASVSDDGGGLDEEMIRKRARENGLFKRPEESYSPEEIRELILQPGLTTNREVTEYSGRGVGLDVVKSILENAGGHLYIRSEKGRGSTFTISMPLSLATMECIRFRVDGYRFSLPARYVYQFMEYKEMKALIRTAAGRSYLPYDGHLVPLVDLRSYFGLGGSVPENAVIVYVRGTEKECCMLADFMYEQKRIVIKQLPALFGPDFRNSTGISGFSIMGGGEICAALDLEVIAVRYEREGRYAAGRD